MILDFLQVPLDMQGQLARGNFKGFSPPLPFRIPVLLEDAHAHRDSG